MGETIKIGILIFLIAFLAIFFINTRGDDELNLDLNLNFTNKDEFTYPVSESEYNGQYRNNKKNGINVLVGKNADGTYRIYFIHEVKSTKNIILKLDAAELVNQKINFKSVEGHDLVLTFSDEELVVSPGIGFGDAKLEGFYRKMQDIDVFSLDEYKFFND